MKEEKKRKNKRKKKEICLQLAQSPSLQYSVRVEKSQVQGKAERHASPKQQGHLPQTSMPRAKLNTQIGMFRIKLTAHLILEY